MPKRKHQATQQHPIDASGVLEAAKFARWDTFYQRLAAPNPQLTFADFNELPPGRNFGVIHQICYHGHRPALERLLETHPRVDLKMRTKDGGSPLSVATTEGADEDFLTCLRERSRVQYHHELVNRARDGEWDELFQSLEADPLPLETMNAVPPGRTWGVLHQICYWGDVSVLDRIANAYPDLDLEVETVEDAQQLPLDIAIGRGHGPFATALRTRIDERKESEEKKPESLVTAPSAGMKVPVPAAGKTCCICFADDHDADTLAVSCDNDHHMCETCFAGWVNSESDINDAPQNVLLNGGRITCPCKKTTDGCNSAAYANKLIAMVVDDALYERYLRARDFVVGKEAVAGALSKIQKNAGDMSAVEQEQIRNMYRREDGTYAAYMCGSCSFGPVDHGWCSSLSSHHGEQKQGGGSINNACPKCGWFTQDIQQWPRWNGQFQSPSQTCKPVQKPVALMTVFELKAALKARGGARCGTKAVLAARLQALYDLQ